MKFSMASPDDTKILAPCGNDCSACPRQLATASRDPARLAAVAELWHFLGWRDRVVSNEEIACHGCPPPRPPVPSPSTHFPT